MADDVTPGSGGEEPAFYFCLDHMAVEGPIGCRGEVRLGPYPTHESAAQALATARARTEQWDDEDREWENRAP